MRLGSPLAPRDSGVRAFYAVGPARGHVGIVLTPSRAEAGRIALKLKGTQEWAVTRASDPSTLILLDASGKPADEELGVRCANN